jgi:hypothetical protein
MQVLGSRRWVWKAGKTPPPLREVLNWQMSCPAGCDAGPLRGAEARIVRSNPRSVTLAYRRGGLQWTMTLHQMAKAAPRWEWHPLLGDDAAEEGPKYLAELALPETRGRTAS